MADKKSKQDLISVIIPCFNEEQYIEKLIQGFLKQDITINFEILICDGMSTDKTREIVKKYSNKHKNIHLLDNTKQKTPYALNIGLEKSKGNYFIIVGAHSEVPANYLSNNYNELIRQSDSIAGIGGKVIPIKTSNKLTNSIEYSTSTIFGGGISTFRFSKVKQLANTVVFGMYKKELINQIRFDTDFTIGQDLEFNLQIKDKGLKLLFDPNVKCKYYNRASWKKFRKQMWNYGVARTKILRKHGIVSFKELIPLLFGIYVTLLIPFEILTSALHLNILAILGIIPIILWGILNLTYSIKKPKLFFNNLLVFTTIHFLFGIGMLKELIKKTKN